MVMKFPKCIFLLALLALGSLLPNRSHALAISEGFVSFYNSGKITAISELILPFDPDQFFRTLIPSNSEKRDGQYFILKLKDFRSAPLDHFELKVINTASKTVHNHTFPYTNPANNAWIYLGLTGDDWPSPSIEPLAWVVHAKDQQGNTLASWKSFLWSRS